jgi:non-ribosomal peptide synthetase component F
VERLEIPRDLSRNPLFDVMFELDNTPVTEKHSPGEKQGVKAAGYSSQHRTAKFDLLFYAAPGEEKLTFMFEYCTHLFKAETIRRFIDYFKRIISRVIAKPGTKLSEIEIITAEEKKRVLIDFNAASAENPTVKTIHELFAQQARQTPGHTALAAPPETHEKDNNMSHTSYMELNEKSHRSGPPVKRKRRQPDTIVGIMLERSIRNDDRPYLAY